MAKKTSTADIEALRFGPLLRYLRMRQRIKQSDASAAIGATSAYIAEIETMATAAPSTERLEKLINFMRLDSAAAELLRAKAQLPHGQVLFKWVATLRIEGDVIKRSVVAETFDHAVAALRRSASEELIGIKRMAKPDVI